VFKIEFQNTHKYGPTGGIVVPVELHSGREKVRFDAKLDTGAEFCLFENAYGALLGLDPDSGEKKTFTTVNSSVIAYGHEVELFILGLSFRLTGYFYEAPEIRRNLLGRGGWLQQVKIGIVDYEQALYLNRYDCD